jgi:flagellar biosynthesis protein FlhG
MAKILTVTSGKGGVGKTNISVNLAVLLAQQGHRICLFDADLGLANINILLGVYPDHNLEDVIDGKKELKDIVIHDKSGIDIIPGSSGVAKMEALSSSELEKLAGAFGKLKEYDYLIFDTSAGIAKNVIAFCMNATEVVLVITPEPTSLTDAYALMKVLSLNGFKQTAKVVVNQTKNPKAAQVAFTKLRDTVLKFLGIHLQPLGTIVSDSRVIEAVAAQKPFITLFPNTHAAMGLKKVTANLLDKIESSENVFALDDFWSRCVDILTASLKLPAKKGEPARKKETAPPAASASPPPAATPATSVGAEGSTPGKTPAAPVGFETTNRLLEQIVEKISIVSQELSGIKTALEKGVLGGNGTGTSSVRPERTPPVIPLDFEAFLGEQESEKKLDD